MVSSLLELLKATTPVSHQPRQNQGGFTLVNTLKHWLKNWHYSQPATTVKFVTVNQYLCLCVCVCVFGEVGLICCSLWPTPLWGRWWGVVHGHRGPAPMWCWWRWVALVATRSLQHPGSRQAPRWPASPPRSCSWCRTQPDRVTGTLWRKERGRKFRGTLIEDKRRETR